MEETGPYVCEHLLFMKYKCSIYCNALKLNLSFLGGWVYKYGHETWRLHSNESNGFTYFLSFCFCEVQNVRT